MQLTAGWRGVWGGGSTALLKPGETSAQQASNVLRQTSAWFRNDARHVDVLLRVALSSPFLALVAGSKRRTALATWKTKQRGRFVPLVVNNRHVECDFFFFVVS